MLIKILAFNYNHCNKPAV